jgi:uncharacterized protein (DUF302 family)
MISQATRYGMNIAVQLEYRDALAAVRAALASEGFGVLCEIDVAAVMKNKLDVDLPPYTILGACNPAFAYKALNAERDIGLLLPCNVIVRAGDAPRTTVVAALDPIEALSLTGNRAIEPLAREVRESLRRALRSVVSA